MRSAPGHCHQQGTSHPAVMIARAISARGACRLGLAGLLLLAILPACVGEGSTRLRLEIALLGSAVGADSVGLKGMPALDRCSHPVTTLFECDFGQGVGGRLSLRVEALSKGNLVAVVDPLVIDLFVGGQRTVQVNLGDPGSGDHPLPDASAADARAPDAPAGDSHRPDGQPPDGQPASDRRPVVDKRPFIDQRIVRPDHALPPDGAAPDSQSCADPTEPCDSDSACCSPGICGGGSSTARTCCLRIGDRECHGSHECCKSESGVQCPDGKCCLPPGSNISCGRDGECCTGTACENGRCVSCLGSFVSCLGSVTPCCGRDEGMKCEEQRGMATMQWQCCLPAGASCERMPGKCCQWGDGWLECSQKQGSTQQVCCIKNGKSCVEEGECCGSSHCKAVMDVTGTISPKCCLAPGEPCGNGDLCCQGRCDQERCAG